MPNETPTDYDSPWKEVLETYFEAFMHFFYRLFDRYRRWVISLAVLADEDAQWRPDHFGYELWGCQAGLWFPTVKLLDYREQWAELEQSDNPFAVVVMAHLQTQATRQEPAKRLEWKWRLVRGVV